MVERPILMNEFSIKQILSGEKTQTRRVIKPQPGRIKWQPVMLNGYTGWVDEHGDPNPCPYGKPGDQLWVRESWKLLGTASEHHLHDSVDLTRDFKIRYLSSPKDVFAIPLPYERISELEVLKSPGKKPSIFMPREFSRIQLKIVAIRAERLQFISGPDAISEGCTKEVLPGWDQITPVEKFANLWSSIHGKGAWDEDPWVWVVEFRE